MADDVLIRASNVSKRFCRDLRRSLIYGVQDIACDLLGKERSESGLRTEEFWANERVSFELRRGECLGLIGHNGAGKTTLLKMLNGLIRPDCGKIEVRGRVGALIALGAGFNPILTGRENVYIAGSVLGLKKNEIDAKYDEIVDFAELEEFMQTPVQSYSSGMQVRLGFAVATAVTPDLLLLDEVLAVGDQQFRSKCLERIGKLAKQAAIVFVSHSMPQIRHICDRVLLMHDGHVAHDGDVDQGISLYNSTAPGNEGEKILVASEGVQIDLETSSGALHTGDRLQMRMFISSQRDQPSSYSRLVIVCETGEPAAIIETSRALNILPKGPLQIEVNIPKLELSAGKYSVNAYISGEKKSELICHGQKLATFKVEGPIAHSISYAPTSTINIIT